MVGRVPIILPHGDSNVLVLSHSILTPLKSFLQQRLQVLREALAVATKSATTVYANPEKVNEKVYTRKKVIKVDVMVPVGNTTILM